MKPRFVIALLAGMLFISASSCHARFKKFARTADVVHMQAVVSGTATVNLAESGGNSTGTFAEAVMDGAVGAAAQIKSGQVRKRLVAIMNPDQVREMVQADATNLLGDGPPFAGHGEPKDGTVQIEILSYGIEQSGGGPAFFANYRIRGYRADNGKKMYKTSASCSDRAFWTPNTPGNVVGTAATIAHIDGMTDEELRATIEAVVQRCTSQVIAKMRKHAS